MAKKRPAHPNEPPPSDDGILHDEYTGDPKSDDGIDALDATTALVGEELLDSIAAGTNGIEELESADDADSVDTVDSGARQPRSDDGEMGLGVEAHSADELAEAALGHSLRGPNATSRDGDQHGERFLDSPDAPGT